MTPPQSKTPLTDATYEDLTIFVRSLKRQLTLANAQIAVKDEALEHISSISKEGGVVRGLCYMALTNSPTASKELLEQNERMRVALKSIQMDAADAGEMMRIARNVLSTTKQPKE